MTFTANGLEALILGQLSTYAWPFFRITGLLMIAPVFGTRLVPARVKIALAVALTAAIAPAVEAGQTIAMTMGLGFATMVDPQRGVSVPLLSQFFVILGILVFLALDGHLALLAMIAESYELMPIGVKKMSSLPKTSRRNEVAQGKMNMMSTSNMRNTMARM